LQLFKEKSLRWSVGVVERWGIGVLKNCSNGVLKVLARKR